MSEINRRKVRQSLKASRRQRRIGTKTKCIPGAGTQGHKFPQYKYFRLQVERPRTKVEREVRRILREGK